MTVQDLSTVVNTIETSIKESVEHFLLWKELKPSYLLENPKIKYRFISNRKI